MNLRYSVIVCASVLSFACTKHNEMIMDVEPEGVEITITATREGLGPETRTVRKSDGSVEWCPLDEISVFYSGGAAAGSKFTSQNTEQAAVAEFRGRLDGISAGGENFTDGKYLYGVYPYSPDNTLNDGIATISLPTHQIAEEGTFADGLFPTIARAQGVNLAFYNICGGVKFTVSRNDITSISFKGNNDEKLAGKAKVAFDSSEIPYVLDEEVASKNEIIVYAPAGGTFKAGKEYFIVAYPAELSAGFTMTFRTSDMKEGVYVRDSAVEISRSLFGVLENVDQNIDSWAEITTSGGGNSSGIYLGITAFNQQLYSYPITQLTTASKAGFDSFIDNLDMKKGTLLYYSVDQTINTMQSVQLPSDLTTAAVVTFTDGLDQGSIMMNVSYQDNISYLNALNYRIKNETVSGQPITAYSVGMRGQDVADVTTFRDNLSKLASSSANATEVSSMAEVNARFKEIAQQLSQNNYVQTINLTMPGVSNGTLVRFTFDNINSAEKSNLYIEGTFNLSTRSLENVKYKGLTSSSGTEIKGVVDGIFVTFTFENVHTDNNVLIDNTFTDEWLYVPSNNIWQINSEFDKNENSDIINVRSSAAIMLVLDCSSSLADDFVKAQANAKDFINTLYEAVGGEDAPGGSGDEEDKTIYSTVPKDLSLAIWKDGKRYYLTKEEYDTANLSGAVIEGVTVVGGGESFIVSLTTVQSDPIESLNWVDSLYRDILPTASQGRVISAKWSEINDAISYFGGTKLSSSRYYYTSLTASGSGYDYTNCIHGSGGGICNTNSKPYVIGSKPTSYNSAIFWTHPDDLKLVAVLNGERVFLNEQEYKEDKASITEIVGVAVIAGGEKFAIHLTDAQIDPISNKSTAQQLYGDIIPTDMQGWIISTKYSDVNAALSRFGGSAFSSSRFYYTSTTLTATGYYDFMYCVNKSGGVLSHTDKTPYIRGVIELD